MATAGEILTGSTDRPLQDSGARGIMVGGVGGIIGAICLLANAPIEVPVLLLPTQAMIGWWVYGAYDRFTRGRVLDRAATPGDAPGSPAP